MDSLRTIVGNVLGSIAVGVGLWVATSDHVAAASACLSAGVLILLIANINHFEFIKGFGFEAKTKKLDEKIEEADRLLDQLREAGQLFADISVQLMARVGRWAGPIPKPETHDLVTRIQSLLETLGVERSRIDRSLDPFHRITLRDLIIPAFNALFAEFEHRKQRTNETIAQRASQGASEGDISVMEWKAIEHFTQETRHKLESSDPFVLGKLLTQSIAGAPGWTAAERQEFTRRVEDSLDEWSFYAKHLRVKNVAAWAAREYGH